MYRHPRKISFAARKGGGGKSTSAISFAGEMAMLGSKVLIMIFDQQDDLADSYLIDTDYDPENYLEAVRGYEDCPERGERCAICFGMRLRKSAEAAARGGFDFYTTTLTISPLKDAALLNEIGAGAGEEFGVPFLPSDFKKKNGFKRSIELSAEFDLYRQNFCGCPFSKRDSLAHSPVHTI